MITFSAQRALWPRCDSCCYTTDLSASQDPCDVLLITRSALSFCDCVSSSSHSSAHPQAVPWPEPAAAPPIRFIHPLHNTGSDNRLKKMNKNLTLLALPLLLRHPMPDGGLWSSTIRGCWWPHKHRKRASRVTFVMENSTMYCTNDVPQLWKVLKMDSSLWTLHTSCCLSWPDCDLWFSC